MICRIIGVLDNGIQGLTPEARNYIQSAHCVIGAKRTLTLFKELLQQADTKDLTGQLAQLPEWINSALDHHQPVVVLATGDPLCHGIAHYLYRKINPALLQVIPNVSTIQWAFARVGVSWQDTRIISVHTGDTGEWFAGAGVEHGLYTALQAILTTHKLAILTSPDNTPDRIARMLITVGIADQFKMIVAEDLLSDHERLVETATIEAIAQQSFNGNNIIILQRQSRADSKVLFGLSDHQFRQRKPDKGLITKREVRAVSLARMQLKPDSIVWDIGAGSGAVGIEAARLCSSGYVFAIEKNQADFDIATDNAKQMAVYNYHLVHHKAPAGMAEWSAPDAVFIGGTGGELARLIELCWQRLNPGGCLVMNFVTFENLATGLETLKALAADWDVTQLQASRSQAILQMYRMQAENPVWIVSAQKEVD